MVQTMVLHMPRFSRGFAKRPINSIKHIEETEGVTAGDTDINIPILDGVGSPPDPFSPGKVMVGSRVSSIFLTVFIIGETGAPVTGSINWYLGCRRGGQDLADFPTPSVTGVSIVRNQIIHEEKGLSGSGDGTPMVFKGVILIPKTYQRIREGDAWFLRLRVTGATNSVTFCQKAIFKSYQ